MSEEYIKRGALDEELKKAAAGYPDFGHIFDIVRERVKRVPAADVEPVVRGEWKWKPPYMVCTACNRHAINRYRSKYCQHCGAKMHNPRGAHMDERSDA